MIERRWDRTDTLALAISGGIDSMVLYHLLKTTYIGTYCRLILLHVNHGVRKESEYEEQYLKKMAEKDGVLIEVCHLNMSHNFTQHDARSARYAFFDEAVERYDADILLTAHHLNDQEETIMHQLLTGRYTHQYVGIKPESSRMDYKILRPLFAVPKNEIEAYQQKHNVHYFEDESNNQTYYTRNYIRHHILSQVYQSEALHEENLVQLAEDLNELTELAREKAEKFLETHTFKLRKQALLNEKKLQQFYIVKSWLDYYNVKVRRKTVSALLDVLENGESQADFTIGDTIVKVRYDDISLSEKIRSISEKLEISTTGIFRFNGYKITVSSSALLPLTVRTRVDGDKLYIKNVGTKKVSRVLIDEKVNREERDVMPVVTDKNERIIALGNIYNIMNTRDGPHRLQIKKEFSYDAKE